MADVDGIVRVGGLDVELQDVVNVVRLNQEGTQTLHHPRLTAQDLKYTAGDKSESRRCDGISSFALTFDIQGLMVCSSVSRLNRGLLYIKLTILVFYIIIYKGTYRQQEINATHCTLW